MRSVSDQERQPVLAGLRFDEIDPALRRAIRDEVRRALESSR